MNFRELVEDTELNEAKFHSVYFEGTKEQAQDAIIALFAMGVTGAYDSSEARDKKYIGIYRKGPGGMGARNAKKVAQVLQRRGFTGYVTDDQYADTPDKAVLKF